MLAALRTWRKRLSDRAGRVPFERGDHGASTTELVIIVAALAALAIVVVGVFGNAIIDAANDVVFQ